MHISSSNTNNCHDLLVDSEDDPAAELKLSQ